MDGSNAMAMRSIMSVMNLSSLLMIPLSAPRCWRVAMILNMSAGEHKHDDARASRCESFCAFDPS